MVKIEKVRTTSQKSKKSKSSSGASRALVPARGSTQISRAPLMKSVTRMGMDAKYPGTRQGGMRIVRREFIGTILGQSPISAWTPTAVAINPGQQQSFPWLSLFGVLFESYTFNGLRYCIDPIVPKTEGGNFLCGIDYDALDAAPTSDLEILQYNDCSDGALSEGAVVPCRGRDDNTLGRRRYTRPGSVPSTGDLKTYDVGNFYVVGLTSTSTSAYVGQPVGRLFVEYDVEFFTPQFSLTTFAQTFSSRINAAGTVSKTAVLGTAPTYAGNLPVTASGNTITFAKAGQYLLDWISTGTGLTVGTPTVTTSGAQVSSTSLTAAVPTAGATNSLWSNIVNVVEPGTVTTDWSALASTITGMVLRIAPYAFGSA